MTDSASYSTFRFTPTAHVGFSVWNNHGNQSLTSVEEKAGARLEIATSQKADVYIGASAEFSQSKSRSSIGGQGEIGGRYKPSQEIGIPLGIYIERGAAYGAAKSYVGAGVTTGLEADLGKLRLGMNAEVGMRNYTYSNNSKTGLNYGLNLNIGGHIARAEAVNTADIRTEPKQALPPTKQAITIGQTIHVPAWEWIERSDMTYTADPDERIFTSGYAAGIEYGASLLVKNITPDGQRALVHYSVTGDTSGTPMENGAEFYIDTDKLSIYESLYQYKRAAELNLRRQITDILANESTHPTTATPQTIEKEWEWVVYALPTQDRFWTVRDEEGHLLNGFTDIGGIQKGGTLTTLGNITTLSGKTYPVQRYHYFGNTADGTPCEDGSIIIGGGFDDYDFAGIQPYL